MPDQIMTTRHAMMRVMIACSTNTSHSSLAVLQVLGHGSESDFDLDCWYVRRTCVRACTQQFSFNPQS